MINEKVICAGFGGQGVMLIGQLISYAGMLEGKEVSWLPSYGPEMRGGTANCSVMVSEKMIGSPIIVDDATSAIIMNGPSLGKFQNDIVANGNIIINSSLVEKKPSREDLKAFYVPANEIAVELGNPKVANMVMLGAYLGITGVVSEENILKALSEKLGAKKAHLIDVNKQAIERGMNAVK